MLDIKNAGLSYDGKETLFSNLNIVLHAGDMFCITGESGKGKTSLLNAIVGFVPLSQGSITVDGLVLNKDNIDEIRKRIAWIPQELAIPSEWVNDMVDIPFTLRANRHIKLDKEKLFKNFELLGLEKDLYKRRVTEISGGQRQRVMIAATALLEKPLLVIDEPTSALDETSVQKVISFLQLLKEKGKSILAVSHDKNFAEACDKQIYL